MTKSSTSCRLADEIVIADAGPLIGLAVIGHLQLLPAMFVKVVVPPAVWAETTSDLTAPGAIEIGRATFVAVESPTIERLKSVQDRLEGGEAEAIALALDLPGAIVLLDDLAARKVAHELHLRYTGTVGILLAARRAGRVPALRPLLEGLARHGLYLSAALVDRALADVGET